MSPVFPNGGANACPVGSGPSYVDTYNTSNQFSGGLQTYDGAGDITADSTTGNSYLYDGEGRICAVQQSVGGLTLMTQYLYDAEGNRVAKGAISTFSCNTASNGFVATNAYVLGPGGEQMTELTSNSGVWQWAHTNVYGGSLSATYDADLSGQTEGKLYFHLSDWLGTRRQQTDYLGNPVLNFTGLPYGDGLSTIPVSSGDAADATEHHFTGKERDAESGLDYFGARYYGSSMGRFMLPDPITVTSARQVDPQQLNLYSYVRNNPLTLTDPSGMIINTDDLNDKDKALWAKIAALANKQNADGSYVNSTLHSAYSALDSDSRTFRIEDDKSLGASTAGRFEITKFNGPNDFSEAKVELNFGVIKDMTSTTPGNYDSSFQKYDGLFGKNGFLMRLTETFGHEASHGVFSINDPAQGVNIQRLINDAHGAMNGVKYPVPPDVLQKVTNMNKALEPTERFAQQQEKIINKELQQKQ